MQLQYPVNKNIKISQRFGENPDLYRSTDGHMGLDFATPMETPVNDASEGDVVWAGLDPETASTPTSGYGNYVMVKHPNGAYTIYAHLSQIVVSVGQHVKAGDLLGYSGNTGRSTGPHLHFEYRTGEGICTAADPEPLLVDRIGAGLYRARVAVAGDGLRLRTAPGTGPEVSVIREMRAGTELTVLDLAGEDCWVKAEVEGQVGYVKARGRGERWVEPLE